MGSNQLLMLLIGSTVIAIMLIVLGLRYKKKHARENFIAPEMGDWQGSVQDDGIIGQVRIRRLEGVEEDTLQSLGVDIVAEATPRVTLRQRKRPSSEMLIVLNVMAPEDRPFVGYEMLQALLSLGLRYGEMNIFHRYEQTTGEGQRWFSLASAVEPGIFDLSTVGALSCPGLTLFMNCADHYNPMTVFDVMLETARQLADDLGGVLQDGQHQRLSDHAITRIRENIRQL